MSCSKYHCWKNRAWPHRKTDKVSFFMWCNEVALNTSGFGGLRLEMSIHMTCAFQIRDSSLAPKNNQTNSVAIYVSSTLEMSLRHLLHLFWLLFATCAAHMPVWIKWTTWYYKWNRLFCYIANITFGGPHPFTHRSYFIIGPESDHCLPLSLTD